MNNGIYMIDSASPASDVSTNNDFLINRLSKRTPIQRFLASK